MKACASSTGKGAPPQMISTSDVRSYLAASGWCSNSASTVGTAAVAVQRYSWIKAMNRSGSNQRSCTSRVRSARWLGVISRSFMIATPKICAIGMAETVTRGPSHLSSSEASATQVALANRLEWDSSTPFERPVVPEE
jgi:hypothetical protein